MSMAPSANRPTPPAGPMGPGGMGPMGRNMMGMPVQKAKDF